MVTLLRQGWLNKEIEAIRTYLRKSAWLIVAEGLESFRKTQVARQVIHALRFKNVRARGCTFWQKF